MPFPESVKDAAFARSSGFCECSRREHNHPAVGCITRITRQTAQFHHITAESVGGKDVLSNCEALCAACHVKTDSYGRRL
jgi:hypothetical protein